MAWYVVLLEIPNVYTSIVYRIQIYTNANADLSEYMYIVADNL